MMHHKNWTIAVLPLIYFAVAQSNCYLLVGQGIQGQVPLELQSENTSTSSVQASWGSRAWLLCFQSSQSSSGINFTFSSRVISNSSFRGFVLCVGLPAEDEPYSVVPCSSSTVSVLPYSSCTLCHHVFSSAVVPNEHSSAPSFFLPISRVLFLKASSHRTCLLCQLFWGYCRFCRLLYYCVSPGSFHGSLRLLGALKPVKSAGRNYHHCSHHTSGHTA